MRRAAGSLEATVKKAESMRSRHLAAAATLITATAPVGLMGSNKGFDDNRDKEVIKVMIWETSAGVLC